MSDVDEGPPKRLKTEATTLASLDECDDYAFILPIDEEVIDVTKIELSLEQSRIETWWDHWGEGDSVGNNLLDKRMMILDNKGLRLQFSVPISLQKGEAEEFLEKIIHAARTIHLDWVELYFAEEVDDLGPFSVRNELEALNSILSSINSISKSEYDKEQALAVLREAVISKIVFLGCRQCENMNRIPDDPCHDVLTAKQLLGSRKDSVRTKLDVACFEEAGKGLVASEDIEIGDVALEIPMDLVISDDFIESDLPDCLKKPNLSPMDKRLLWIMRERSCPRTKFKEFFELLQEKPKSGVWFSRDAVEMLRFTPLETALLPKKRSLKYQFNYVIKPILKENCAMFPSCDINAFMSAWALWNSHSVGIVFPDEKLRSCLVPVACLFNHSQCPHVLYGKHISSAGTIQFIASRPCKKGEQCYLSYGNLSGAEFVTFYGFLPKGVNYHDVVSFGFHDDFSQESIWPPKEKRHWISQMAKGKWPDSKKSGVTKGLVEHLKAVMEAQSGDDFSSSEEGVYDRVIDYMMLLTPELTMMPSDQCDVNSWDVKLAYDYSAQYRNLVGDVIGECDEGIHRVKLHD